MRWSLSSCAAPPKCQVQGYPPFETHLKPKPAVRSIVISPLYRAHGPCLVYGLNFLYFLSNSCSSEKVDRPRLWIPRVCHLWGSVSVRPLSPSSDRNPKANWHKQQREFTSLQSGMATSRSPNLIFRSLSLLSPFLSVCLDRPL